MMDLEAVVVAGPAEDDMANGGSLPHFQRAPGAPLAQDRLERGVDRDDAIRRQHLG
jgi:hypothetical protein